MSLPIVNLDDRRFQDLVDEARRLVPQLCPEWTNLGPADPGTAIIELFAWMTEMVIFRLNQVPDAFYTRMLDLIGVAPFPPRAAQVDLTFWRTRGITDDVLVPAGTEVTTAFDEAVFATLADVMISTSALIAMRADGDGRSVDQLHQLRGGDDVDCFVSVTPGASWYLGFDRPLSRSVIELDIDCSGDDETGVAEPPLVWEYWRGEAWAAAIVDDTTHGLRRPGRVTIAVNAGHEPHSLGGEHAHWLRARLVPPVPGQPLYSQSPKVSRLTAAIVGGVAPAEHSRTMPGEVVGVSNGEPGQRFAVRSHPVLPRREGETIRVFAGGSGSDWTEVPDFLGSGPDDRHVTWNSSSGEIRFGPRIRQSDGAVRQFGAVPPFGAEVTVTRYRVGGGAEGNVGAGTLRVLRSPIPHIDAVTNVTPAAGGVDGETVENAKQRGPAILRRGFQLITADDYERLVLETDASIARVACRPPSHPGDAVRVMVVPYVGRAPDEQSLDDYALSDHLLHRLMEVVDERRVLGVSVEIGTPYYHGVSVAALVKARPGRPPAVVRARATRALYDLINPISGGRAGQGWPFGADLNVSMLFGLLESVEGVERVDDVLLFEYDVLTAERIGFGRDTIRLEPDSLFLSAHHQVVVR